MRSISPRFIIIVGAFLTFTFAASGATWATTVNYSGGKVTSISGLFFDSHYYDVTFLGPGGQSYNDAYGSTSFESYGDATSAAALATAIINVLNAETPIPYIDGSTSPDYSGFNIPYDVTATTTKFVYVVSYQLNPFILLGNGQDFDRNDPIDTAPPDVLDWVTVSLQTPLPAAFPLFATGLGAFGLLGWGRKRKAKTA